MGNRFIKIMNDNQEVYKGNIKKILNEAKIKLSEAKDIYIEDKLAKYEDKIIKQAISDIKAVQQDYLQTTAKLLDNEQYRMNNPQIVALSNTEKLLNEIRRSNQLSLNSLRIASMSTDDIIQSCIENSSEEYVLQAKKELLNRANTLSDENAANQLRATARGLKHYTEADELADALKEFEIMSADRNLMPGVSIGERLAIGDIEEFLLKDTKLEADRIAQATD